MKGLEHLFAKYYERDIDAVSTYVITGQLTCFGFFRKTDFYSGLGYMIIPTRYMKFTSPPSPRPFYIYGRHTNAVDSFDHCR